MMVDVLLTKKAYILHISVILKMSITLFFLSKYSCAILENYMYVFFWARLCSFFLLPVCFCTIIQIKMVSEYEVTSCAYKFYLKKQSLLAHRGVTSQSLLGYMHILFSVGILNIAQLEQIHFHSTLAIFHAISAISPVHIFDLKN